MWSKRVKAYCALALTMGGAAWTVNGVAQGYPNRPIRILVGFTPGGASDIS